MYTIGLIDDEESQLKTIRRTIKTNAPKNELYDFKAYLIPDKASDVVTEVFNQVMIDIKNMSLSTLIIDYKIMVKTSKIEGTDIFKRIKEEVPKFPIIILTEIVEESMTPDFIDADKVYRKKDFYKLESDYSKEKVWNIFDSMRKYNEQRNKLQLSLEDLKLRLINEHSRNDIIREILALESKLDDFIPTNLSQIDKLFDESKAKKIVELIEKANNLLG